MTAERIARCGCGQLTATCRGEPLRVSVCHCLNCQRRSGSAFASQVRFPASAVTIAGDTAEWRLAGDSGSIATFRRCTTCGATIAYVSEAKEDEVAIPLGAFAGQDMPTPAYSVYEDRRRDWVSIVGEGIEHYG